VKKVIFSTLIFCLTPCLLLAQYRHTTWEEIHEIAAGVCEQIPDDSFDVLLGISVGGLVPTALFSLELGTKQVATISARSYDGERQGYLSVSNGPEREAIEGKRVLIVDDIVDTGATVDRIKSLLLERYGAKSVQIASLFVNEKHGRYPDYWGVESNDWVIFPWEISLLDREEGL